MRASAASAPWHWAQPGNLHRSYRSTMPLGLTSHSLNVEKRVVMVTPS